MTGVDALFAKPGMLPLQQIQHQRGVPEDQGEKARAIQPQQKQWRQSFGITTVAFTGLNEIAVEEEFSRAITNAVTWTMAQLDQTSLQNMHGLNRLSPPEHKSARRKCQSIAFRMRGD